MKPVKQMLMVNGVFLKMSSCHSYNSSSSCRLTAGSKEWIHYGGYLNGVYSHADAVPACCKAS